MTVITVKDGELIQDAINGASSCDTIRIEAGTFRGFSVANTTYPMNPVPIPRLKIIGAGIGKTIIDGTQASADTDGIVFIPSGSDQTSLECFTVQNYSDGDGVHSDSNANILCQVEAKDNGFDGFEIDGDRNLVLKCIASGNQAHGFVIDSNNNYFIDCQAIDNGFEGFESDDGTHTLYFNCLAKGNENDGFEAGDFDLLLCNQAINNGADGVNLEGDGALVFDNVVCENVDRGIDGISLGAVIYGNDVCGNDTGIELDSNDNNNNVVNNFIKGNKTNGIRLESNPDVQEGASENLIDDNTVEDNEGVGILLTNLTEDNCVRSNCAFDNADNDLEANPPADTNNTFVENKCDNSSPAGLCDGCLSKRKKLSKPKKLDALKAMKEEISVTKKQKEQLINVHDSLFKKMDESENKYEEQLKLIEKKQKEQLINAHDSLFKKMDESENKYEEQLKLIEKNQKEQDKKITETLKSIQEVKDKKRFF